MMVDLFNQEEAVKDLIAAERAQSKEENKIETATTMLNDGMDHQMVAKYSHLPIEKVEELARSLSA